MIIVPEKIKDIVPLVEEKYGKCKVVPNPEYIRMYGYSSFWNAIAFAREIKNS